MRETTYAGLGPRGEDFVVQGDVPVAKFRVSISAIY